MIFIFVISFNIGRLVSGMQDIQDCVRVTYIALSKIALKGSLRVFNLAFKVWSSAEVFLKHKSLKLDQIQHFISVRIYGSEKGK